MPAADGAAEKREPYLCFAGHCAFGILGDLKTAAGDTGAYIDLMFKILGISIVTQVVCDVCRDNGASALASQTETAAKILVLSLLLPLFQTVIGIVTGLVK